MEVKINKQFLRDLAKIPANDRLKIEELIFDKIENFETLESVGIFEKIKGYQFFYRARIGNFRVGVRFENDILVFERVLHRKEIYRYFP